MEFNNQKKKRAEDITKISQMIRNLENTNSKKWTIYKSKNKVDIDIVQRFIITKNSIIIFKKFLKFEQKKSETDLDENQLILDISDSRQLLDRLRAKENEGLENLLKQTKNLQKIIQGLTFFFKFLNICDLIFDCFFVIDLTDGLTEGIKRETEIEKSVDENIEVVKKQEVVLEKAKKTVDTKMKLIGIIVLLVVVLFFGFGLLAVSIAAFEFL